MNLLDLLGAIASLSSTLLFISVNRLAWVITILATLLNGYLYFQKGIYAEMTLEVAYFASAFYGWFAWKMPKKQNHSEITTLSSILQWLTLIVSWSVLYSLLWYVLSHYTNTSVASLDATTTALSLMAQWLMCRKVIVTWALWFITDLIYVYLYFIKALPFHASLALIYTGLAITGYLRWRKYQRQTLNLVAANISTSTLTD